MHRHLAITSLAAAATILAVPAGAPAQEPPATPSLTSPLAPCYSPTFASLRKNSTGATIGPLTFNGPPGKWSVEAATAPGGPFAAFNGRSVTLDAAGMGALPDGIPLAINFTGPGVPLALTMRKALTDEPETTVGTTKLAALRVDFVRKAQEAGAETRKPKPLVVSGAPFAGKTLYAFLVRYRPKPGRQTAVDPAARSRDVVRRTVLGKADACGYVRKTVKVAPPRTGTRAYMLYVNAGPKLDKARAVFTESA